MINWQQFGLRSNPYDTLPLIEGGELPIKEAFVGRAGELKNLKEIFLSENRSCLLILGNVGVGKTSLANFHKFLFKYQEDNKALFSFRREIEASENILNKRSFILEVIGSVIREIKLLEPELIQSNELLSKLGKMVDITQTLGISGGVNFGIANIGLQEQETKFPTNISMTILESYFLDLIKLIKSTKIAGKRFKGLIIHVNNFDILLSDKSNKKKVLNFFQEIRDLLQTPDVYYLFLGPTHFFRDIIAQEKRLKSIFHLSPLLVDPLTKSEVLQAFEDRMELLKSRDVATYIAPFSNDVIFNLYDLYNGDVRSIMNGLKAILSQISDSVAEPLGVDEAMLLLGRERWESIEKLSFTKEQEAILRYLAVAEEYITQKDISTKLGKAPSNISGYYFNPLKDAGIIEVKKIVGNTKYWGLTQEYVSIKYILSSRKSIQVKALEEMKQLQLFER